MPSFCFLTSTVSFHVAIVQLGKEAGTKSYSVSLPVSSAGKQLNVRHLSVKITIGRTKDLNQESDSHLKKYFSNKVQAVLLIGS